MQHQERTSQRRIRRIKSRILLPSTILSSPPNPLKDERARAEQINAGQNPADRRTKIHKAPLSLSTQNRMRNSRTAAAIEITSELNECRRRRPLEECYTGRRVINKGVCTCRKRRIRNLDKRKEKDRQQNKTSRQISMESGGMRQQQQQKPQHDHTRRQKLPCTSLWSMNHLLLRSAASIQKAHSDHGCSRARTRVDRQPSTRTVVSFLDGHLFAIEDHDVGFVAARYVDRHGQGLAVCGDFNLLGVESLSVDLVDAFDGVIVDAMA